MKAALKDKVPDETALFTKLLNVIMVFVGVFVLVRFGELIYHNKLAYIAKFDFYSILFIIEMLWFAAGLYIFSSAKRRVDAQWLFLGALCILLGAAQWRFSYTLLSFNPGTGHVYFPAAQEILITVGFVSIEIVVYVLAVKFLPILQFPVKKLKAASGNGTTTQQAANA